MGYEGQPGRWAERNSALRSTSAARRACESARSRNRINLDNVARQQAEFCSCGSWHSRRMGQSEMSWQVPTRAILRQFAEVIDVAAPAASSSPLNGIGQATNVRYIGEDWNMGNTRQIGSCMTPRGRRSGTGTTTQGQWVR